MNWGDEKYVKLYTRQTATWRLWPWQARCLFPLMLQVANGTGVVDVGTREPLEALAILVMVPAELIEPAIAALLADGTIEQVESGFLIVNYIEAQEAIRVPSARKRDQRERDRAKARETTEVPVTRSHAVSRSVTTRPDQTSSAQLSSSQNKPTQPNTDQRAPAKSKKPKQAALPGLPEEPKPPRKKAGWEIIFEDFLERRAERLEELGLPFTPDRPPNWGMVSANIARWREYFDQGPELLTKALDGCTKSETMVLGLWDEYLKEPYPAKYDPPYAFEPLCSEKWFPKLLERVLPKVEIEREQARRAAAAQVESAGVLN